MSTLKTGQKVRVTEKFGSDGPQAGDPSYKRIHGLEAKITNIGEVYIEVLMDTQGVHRGKWLFLPEELEAV